MEFVRNGKMKENEKNKRESLLSKLKINVLLHYKYTPRSSSPHHLNQTSFPTMLKNTNVPPKRCTNQILTPPLLTRFFLRSYTERPSSNLHV